VKVRAEEESEGECSDNLNMANTILAADSAVRAGISVWLHVAKQYINTQYFVQQHHRSEWIDAPLRCPCPW
jgi:hypothetical protein